MSIRATFPAGVTEMTAHGLHQWDYGQTLEIAADNLPALAEVHFATAGMTDAIRRVGDTTTGALVVTIPDQCLEQTAPVLAWVYRVDEEAGATILTVTLPVIKRARPQPNTTMPEAVGDQYTALMGLVNQMIDDLNGGTLAIINAQYADEAGHAETADSATKATSDANGTDIASSYVRKNGVYLTLNLGTKEIRSGIVAFRVTGYDVAEMGTPIAPASVILDLIGKTKSPMFKLLVPTNVDVTGVRQLELDCEIVCTPAATSGQYTVALKCYGEGASAAIFDNIEVTYKYLSAAY